MTFHRWQSSLTSSLRNIRAWLTAKTTRGVLIAIGAFILISCFDPFYWYESEFFGYFVPRTSTEDVALRPYFFSPEVLYPTEDLDTASDSLLLVCDDNIRDWYNELHRKFTPMDIHHTLALSSDSLNYLLAHPKAIQSPFISALKTPEHAALLSYLRFALAVNNAEGLSGSNDWPPQQLNPEMLRPYLTIAIQHASTDASQRTGEFIKQRYAFQAIKIADELGSSDSAILLYHRYFASPPHSAIDYWALARLAGAQLHHGDTAKVLSEFATIFANSPSKRFAAYASVLNSTHGFTPKSLQFAHSTNDTAAIYAICAVQRWTNAIGYLKELLRLTPNEDMTRLVMSREINRNEFAAHKAPRNAPWPSYYEQPSQQESTRHELVRDTAMDYFHQLQQVALDACKNPQIQQKAFWMLAASYVSLVCHEFGTANELFHQAEQLYAASHTTDPAVEEQLKIQRLLLRIEPMTSVTSDDEAELAPLLYALRSPRDFYECNARDYSCARLATLYRNAASKPRESGIFGCAASNPRVRFPMAKAFLLDLATAAGSDPSYGSTQHHISTINADQLIDSCPTSTLENAVAYYKTEHDWSAFDTTLRALSRLSTSSLYYLRGNAAMHAFNYTKAAEFFAHVEDSTWTNEPFHTYLAANPFWTGILDIHERVPADSIRYTPRSFAKRMNQLQSAADAEEQSGNHQTAAESYYLLGCAMYNQSQFGNAWLLQRRSKTNYPDLIHDSLNGTLMRKAITYCERAASLTNNAELAAKATWLRTKCNQKLAYAEAQRKSGDRFAWGEPDDWNDGMDSIDHWLELEQRPYVRNDFSTMSTKFSSTQFARELLKECRYYRDFAEGQWR